MKSRILLLLVSFLAVGVLIPACTPPSRPAETAQPGATTLSPTLILPPVVTAEPVPDTLQPPTSQTVDETLPAVVAARKTLAESLKVSPSQIKVIGAEQVEWSDSCLGAAGRDEMCLMVITPGYRVTLQEGSRMYFVHTNLAGSSVRLARY